MSQCEPLLVSWSLSAWSLSPWPLSRRLARSASLNVELQQSEGKEGRREGREGKGRKRAVGGRHNLTLTPHDYLYLIAAVIWLGTGMRERHMLARMCFFLLFLDGVLTFEQMAACCWHNWVLRGNFPSGDEREKKNFCIGHVQGSTQFSTTF